MRYQLVALMLVFSFTALAEDVIKNNASETSKHYSAQPSLYMFDDISKEKLSDKITRQYIMGSHPCW